MNQNKLKPCNCFLCKPKRLIGIEFLKYYENGGTKEHLVPWSFAFDSIEVANKKLVEQIMQAEKKAETSTKQRVDNFVIETIKKHFE